MISSTSPIFSNISLAMSGSGAQPGSGGILQSLLPFLVMGIAFYFLIIAPGRKKQKDHQKMIDALEKGVKVKNIFSLLRLKNMKKNFKFNVSTKLPL